MDDKDNLYFSFDDEKEEPEQEKEVKAEEGQNRSFVVVAVVLGAVFVLGICAVVGYLFFGQQLQALLGGGTQAAQGPSSNELTNQFMQTAIALTATTNFETQSAPTSVPTKTAAPKPSVTPTSSIGQTTQVGTQDGTQIAEVTQEGTPGTLAATATKGLAGAATTAAPTTGTPGTPGTAAAGGGPGTTTTPTVKPTSSIIEVTALGGGPTPTKIVSGVGTGSPTSSIIEVTGGQGGGGTGAPTGIGGPTTPGVTATIPATGFGGGAGLAGAGLLAMLLVVVVVVVRKIRLNQ